MGRCTVLVLTLLAAGCVGEENDQVNGTTLALDEGEVPGDEAPIDEAPIDDGEVTPVEPAVTVDCSGVPSRADRITESGWGPSMRLWPDGRQNNPFMSLRQASGSDYSWGKLVQARAGDRVWIDVSLNGGASWTQCGPFTVPAGRTSVETEKGPYTSRGYHTRVCADRAIGGGRRYHRCTGWAYDPE